MSSLTNPVQLIIQLISIHCKKTAAAFIPMSVSFHLHPSLTTLGCQFPSLKLTPPTLTRRSDSLSVLLSPLHAPGVVGALHLPLEGLMFLPSMDHPASVFSQLYDCQGDLPGRMFMLVLPLPSASAVSTFAPFTVGPSLHFSAL